MSCIEDAPQSSQTEEVTKHVVTSIADQLETDPLSLPPLARTVDLDALVAVVGSDAVTEVSFTYDGHEVVVDGSGRVNVTDE